MKLSVHVITLAWIVFQIRAVVSVDSTGSDDIDFRRMTEEEKATACDFRQGNLIGQERQCKYIKIGWHGSEGRFKESLERGISAEQLKKGNEDQDYKRLLGFGFYISDSATAIEKAYLKSRDSILCSIYAPTSSFSKQWTKIYIPEYVEVSSEDSEPSIKEVHYSRSGIRRYLKLLERKGKLEDHPEDSDPLLITEFDGDDVSEMEMMIPPSKFKYLQADCSPLSTFGRLKPLNMDWRSLINNYSNLWKAANYGSPIKSAQLREFVSDRTNDGEDISEERI
ncbi:hypothetical protein BKA69DRAFT_187800 [Paraphysoderma sedebokerense]|nr:hypothetical protein BKA69DRAFT_187800 [Paraphysoderma sedebokerense]